MKRQLPLLFALSSAAALAAMAGFSNVSANVMNSGLRVSFTETGVQPNSNVSYRATADASAVYACINNGGNTPNANNKRTTVNANVHGAATLTANQNGMVTGGVNIPAPGAGTFSCPRGQTRKLSSIRFTNVQLTDRTNNVSTGVAGTFNKVIIKLP